MKHVIIEKPHHLALVEVDEPLPEAGEVLLAVKSVGICGSDLHVFEGQHPFVRYPVLPGHEVSGEIMAVGADVDPTLVGKKAVIEPSLPAGTRPRFEAGRYNIASDLRVMGFQVPGAMAERFAVSQDRLHVLPDHFRHDFGVVVEPLAVAVHGVRLAGNIAGLRVGVIGAGTIGILTAQVARAYAAASVTVAEFDDQRRELVAKLGFETTDTLPKGQFDVVLECVGVEASMHSAIFACAKGATIIVLGVFGKEVSLPVALIQNWELRVLGSLMYIGDDYREAIRLLEAGQIEVSALITHRFPLTQVGEAFNTALQRGRVLKVVLENEM